MGMIHNVEILDENNLFYDNRMNEWDMHSVVDSVAWLGGIDGHVVGYDDVDIWWYSLRAYCVYQEFGSLNLTSFQWRRNYVC